MPRTSKRGATANASADHGQQRTERKPKRGRVDIGGPRGAPSLAAGGVARVTPEGAVPKAAVPLTPTCWRQCDGILEFFSASGVTVDWDHVRLDPDPATTGWRVVAHTNLERDALLGTIPKSACLSTLTTSIAAELQAEGLTGGLGLTVAVLIERALGHRSRWAGYFASLPDLVPLPVFWSDPDLAVLKGTELDGAVPGELAAMTEDYDRHVRQFVETYFHGDSAVSNKCTLTDFCTAASLVASRAFHVDPEHGDAMVPFADIFNHRSAIIVLGSGVAIQGQDNSDDDASDGEDDAASAASGSGDEADDGDDSAAGDEGEGGSSAVSGMAICETVREELKQTPVHSEHPLNIAICNRDEDETTAAAALEIVLMHSVKAGSEIWNTYGELSNGALLMKYGFTEAGNPHSIVNVDFDTALNEINVQFGDDACAEASELLRADGVFEDDGLFEIGADGTLPAALVFLVYCVSGDAPKKFLKVLSSDPVAAAVSVDPAKLSQHKSTRKCLEGILLARLALYRSGKRDVKEPDLHKLAKESLERDQRALDRAQASGRSYRRIAALLLRVEEQAILLNALDKI